MQDLRRLHTIALATALALLLVGISAPATAHKEHKKQPAAAQVVAAPTQTSGEPTTLGSTGPMHAQMGEEMGGPDDDRSRTTLERLLNWLGRLHPILVHFPIAFFPAALFTAIVGRRRPGFAAPLQFLVVAGGIIAPIAAILGWLDAIGADPDPLLTVHRWLGTLVGIASLALGIWTWRQPDRNRSMAMVVALSVLTVMIVIQGWYGGAIVHGIDHMNW